jgi:hypothetical protein
MKNAVLCDVTPSGLALVRADVPEERVASLLRFLVTANVVTSSVILFSLMMEAIQSSETSAFRRAIRRYISEDGLIQQPQVCTEFCQLMFVHLLEAVHQR